MLFSIITPCYNSEKTITRTIESMLNQSFDDYEYIIVDGASKDNTISIINSYKAMFGDKLKVVSEPDSGIYDAMNKGIRLSRGEIIGIVNSDDFYEPNCLEYVKEAYDTGEKYQILYGMMRSVNERGEELSVSFNHHRNMCAEMINHPACFVTKRIYEHFGMYDLSFKSAADLDFMLKMSIEKDISFKPIHRILTNYEIGGMSSSYIGIQENNDVKYRHGLVSKKKYLLTRTKNAMKHWLGV